MLKLGRSPGGNAGAGVGENGGGGEGTVASQGEVTHCEEVDDDEVETRGQENKMQVEDAGAGRASGHVEKSVDKPDRSSQWNGDVATPVRTLVVSFLDVRMSLLMLRRVRWYPSTGRHAFRTDWMRSTPRTRPS